MPEPISLDKLSLMLADPDVPEKDLIPFLRTERIDENEKTISPSERGMGPVLMPNKYVIGDLDDGQGDQAKLGLGFLNTRYRARRRKAFEKDIREGVGKPILLAEGDSWFEFPIWLHDVVDYLSQFYSIYCLSAAGDELEGMIAEAEYKDYLDELVTKRGLEVRGILLSGGGNDIVGETFHDLLKDYSEGATAASLINETAFKKKFKSIRGYYRDALDFITGTYPQIPIFIHGYDYANPLPDQGFHIPPRDGWLGEWLRKRGVLDERNDLQRGIVKRLIDDFCDSQQLLENEYEAVTFVDCREIVGDRWNDELHPNNAGFRDVAQKFREALVEKGIR